MLATIQDLTVELVPHTASEPRSRWDGPDLDRPLSRDGYGQAEELCDALGSPDALYSSPALRCRQTVAPLARSHGLDIRILDELSALDDFSSPVELTGSAYAPIAQAVGGAWGVGLVLRAFGHAAVSGTRAVMCTHGDLVPLAVSALAAYYGCPIPEPVRTGGWHRLRFTGDGLVIATRFPDERARKPVLA